VLREPYQHDIDEIAEVLAHADRLRFGLEEPPNAQSVISLVEKAQRARREGAALTYAIGLADSSAVVGLIQVRALDPLLQTGEWDFVLVPEARGTGLFLEAARLVGSLLFDVLGTHRLECRVPLRNGRGNGALNKLGAVQEGILRRSGRSGGDYLDQALWALLKEDWDVRWSPAADWVH